MDKIAQRRGLLNQLREKVNMPGAYLEGFFKPELDRVMTSLKELDDRIRSILVGKQIGNGNPPEDAAASKDLLKSARTNFNRREYMAGVADLGRFHKQMYLITQDIAKFFVDVNKIHHKFLFEGLPEDHQTNLQKLRQHMEGVQKSSSSQQYNLIKEAGIMDFFYNIGTKRGRSLAAWEKKYPKEVKALRDGGDRLINDAQKLLDNTISNLKKMATARALRHPDQYMDVANNIKSDFDKFDSGKNGFREYYNSVIMPWLKIKDEIDAKEQPNTANVPNNTPSINQVELGSPSPNPTPTPTPTPTPVPAVAPGGVSPPFAPLADKPVLELSPEDDDKTDPNMELPPKIRVSTDPKIRVAFNHSNFYQSLEKMQHETPVILANFIAKYATAIQHTDPVIALELFKVARQIKE